MSENIHNRSVPNLREIRMECDEQIDMDLEETVEVKDITHTRWGQYVTQVSKLSKIQEVSVASMCT